MTRSWLAAAIVGGVALAAACSTAAQSPAKNSAFPNVAIEMLAQGQVKALPAGKIFVNILEFRPLPSADFGPHAHIPAMVYTLHGISTISYQGAAARSVGSGQAAFIPGLAVHTHQNLDGRIGAGAGAVGLIIVVILLCAATWLRGGRRRVAIAVLSVLLVVGGTLPLIGVTSNDYYLISVRPDAQRGLAMPRPDGYVFFTSPDIDPVPAGPYIETLSAITVPAGGHYDAPGAPGPEMIIVAEGTASVQIGNETTQLNGGGATFAQMGQILAIGNQGSGTLKLLVFAITSLSAVPAGI